MLKRRLIFTLLCNHGVFMLSRNYRLQAVGDQRWIDDNYDFAAIAHSIDELVVLDVARENRSVAAFTPHLHRLARRCFVPIAAGGGVRSVDDARALLRAGADKVVVDSLVHDAPDAVKALVSTFGRQAVVAAVDYRVVADGGVGGGVRGAGVGGAGAAGARRVEVVVDHGTRVVGASADASAAVVAARRAEELGAGEIYLSAIERDGTGQGCDLATIAAVAAAVGVPVVAAGGVGKDQHFVDGLGVAPSVAVATANLFNFMADGLTEARSFARTAGVPLARSSPWFATGRAGLVVTARARSSRIQEKMLADVGGRPALAVVLERMKPAPLVDVRVVCTSSAPDDDRLASLAQAAGWDVIRGDEEDVLSRYLQAALEHELELVVNVDGDDLFCSVDHVGELVSRYRSERADFISCDGLPFGGAPVAVRSEALRQVCARKTERVTQGWGKYFTKSGEFTCATVPAPPELAHPELRITLDYEEDLALARAVVAGLGAGSALALRDVVAWLLAHPEEAARAQAVTEKYWERFHAQHDAWGLAPRE